MHEIKHIHLGRTPFTISVEAHKQLRDYLDAIRAQVGKDDDVVDEVELRMAELLSERGISGDKVVLPADVEYLKEQLGEPRDFSESESETSRTKTAEDTTRRLFRDTDNAMIAGVAAGLARYFDIDASIVRILFVALVFAGGSGILIYALLWMLVPEAKTGSDRLQMRGRAVTVDSLKEVVERADVPGAAQRASRTIGKVLEGAFKFLLAFIGVVLTAVGAASALWIMALAGYILLDGAKVAGTVIFPMGTREVWAFVATVVAILMVLFSMILIGVAMVRRRWQLPAWGVAAIVGLFFLSASVGGALAPDVVPRVHDRVEALNHSKIVRLPAFNSAELQGSDTRFVFVPDTRTYVEYKYFGNADLHDVSAKVSGQTLNVSTGKVSEISSCSLFCIYSGPDLYVYIHAPSLDHVKVSGDQANFYNEHALAQPAMTLTVAADSMASLAHVYPAVAELRDNNTGDRTLAVTFGSAVLPEDGVSVDDESNQGTVGFNRVGELNVVNDRVCDESDPFVFALNGVSKLQINGKDTPSTESGLNALHSSDQNNLYNCVVVGTGPRFMPYSKEPALPQLRD
jgi:phage shock protein PspC (stress-responsive transcriptional regulator)